MSVETMHVWNAPGKGFFLRGMCGHSILGILNFDFQWLSAFFSLSTSRVGNEGDLLTQWLVLRQSFALIDKMFVKDG